MCKVTRVTAVVKQITKVLGPLVSFQKDKMNSVIHYPIGSVYFFTENIQSIKHQADRNSTLLFM